MEAPIYTDHQHCCTECIEDLPTYWRLADPLCVDCCHSPAYLQDTTCAVYTIELSRGLPCPVCLPVPSIHMGIFTRRLKNGWSALSVINRNDAAKSMVQRFAWCVAASTSCMCQNNFGISMARAKHACYSCAEPACIAIARAQRTF